MKESEMLKKLLEHINNKKCCYSLCYSVYNMYANKIISYTTLSILEDYIRDNKPFTWYSFLNISPYWWKPGLVEPRRKWLEKHIKKLEKKEL